ncbi:hypothetical protein ACHQM5_019484 [Ranunculus cassubicifolius]
MLEFLFGWRKASRCKKLIRRVQCRLKLLKNKRDSIVRQVKQDVVQLIKSGHQECAISRIEQLHKDQNIKAVYDLLDNFCEFIIINLSYIRKHRDCPNDINEAVSSLLYASARCGDLPELIKLRKIFGDRYGQKFAMNAVELLNGNLVNRQMIENLCVKSLQEDLKLNLLKEIVQGNGLKLDCPEIYGEFEQQDLQKSDIKLIECDSEKDIKFTYDSIDGAILQASDREEAQEIAKPNNATSEREIVAVKSDSNSLLVHSETHEEMVPVNEAEVISNRSSCQSIPERSNSNTVTESPSYLSERSIVYLDDVEELEGNVKEDVKEADQRMFMFISKSSLSVRTRRSSITDSLSVDRIEPAELSDGKLSSRGSSKRSHSARKRSKRRYLSIKDIECALYYGESDYSSDDELSSVKSYPQRKLQPKLNNAEIKGEVEKIAIKMEEAEVIDCRRSCASSRDSYSRVTSPWTNTRPPYSRALTMPTERPKETPDYQIPRSTSCLPNQQSPSYIHPKLPEYDDLAAKFKSLREGCSVSSTGDARNSYR